MALNKAFRPWPDGILTLKPPSVLKKLKDENFAAGVDCSEVAESECRLDLTIELTAFVRGGQ